MTFFETYVLILYTNESNFVYKKSGNMSFDMFPEYFIPVL